MRDAGGRLLLVRRGQDPERGRWSVPGGRVEPGETSQEAAVREVLEETGLHVVVTGVAGRVELPAPDGGVYDVVDHFARVEPGTDPDALRAGGDADEVGWFDASQVERLDLTTGLAGTLRGWGVLPPSG